VATVIAGDPDAVFAYLDDDARLPEWQTGVQHARREPPGAVEAGTRVREIRRVAGRQVIFTDEIIAHDRGARIRTERVCDGVIADMIGC
jgi:hypothetical protein